MLPFLFKMKDNNMDITNWKLFRMDELFNSFERGKVHSQNSLSNGDEYFYVGAKKNRCGVMVKCGYDKDLISKGNCIIFICNGEGSVGYSNYMDRDFMASGDLLLAYGDFLNVYTALFIVTMLDRERPKYSFGRKYGKYVKSTTIPLPIKENVKKPDWEWVENYVKQHLLPQLPTKANKVWGNVYNRGALNKQRLQISDRDWQLIKLSDFCDYPYKATAYNAIELEPCSLNEPDSIPYITRTEENNGCKFFVKRTDELYSIESGNAITIGDTTATINYQCRDFICGDHIVILRSSHFNKYTAQFIVTLLNKERFRYNYGRAFNKDIIANTRLRLPIIIGGKTPDWDFIEDYIKGLPYSLNI